MALNPQFPNYANGAAGTEVIFWTVVGGLPLYRLPAKLVDTGFGAAMVGGGSTPYGPDSDEFSPPKIISPGTLEGIFIEDEVITHTPAVVVGDVTTQTVEWFVKRTTGTVKVGENVDTYTLQTADVGGFVYVKVTAEGPYGTDTAVTQSYGPVLPNTVPVPVLTATFTPSDEVGTDASLEITGCTNGTVTKVQVLADQTGVIQTVNVGSLPVTVTQAGDSLVRYVGQYLIFKVTVVDGSGDNIVITYTCGPIVGVAPVIDGVGSIAGTPQVGQVLTFTPPSATGTPAPTLTYNWYRSGSSVVIGTGLTYTAANDDLAKFLYVTTVATSVMGSDTASSADFGPIFGTDPVITDPGTIAPDSVEVGETITLNPVPTATGNPEPQVSWVWRDGVDESRVLQVGGTTYKAKEADTGRTIVVASKAVNLSGEDNGLSNEVSVAAGPPIVETPSVLYDTTPEVRQQIGGKKATFAGYPVPVITSFGFWDYTDPMNPVQLVDGEDVTTYEVKDEDFNKEIAFVTVAQNDYGVTTSVSTISSPVTGFLVVTGASQLSFSGRLEPGTVLNGGKAGFNGVPIPSISQFGFAYDNEDGTYTPILSAVGLTSYTIASGDVGKSIAFYTTATNAANPSGLTSYSASTGAIGENFEFLSTGGVVSADPAPVVGETLTIDYAVTQPHNQKNTPPGPAALTWNWISDADPSTPLTTANAETYVVKPGDYGHKIGLVWLATYGAESLGAQSEYSPAVTGDAPAVLTPAVLTGDVSSIPATITLTPATFSGSNVTTSWVWVDDQGTVWKTGGLTLVTNSNMAGRRMQVKTTATNFAGSVTDSSAFTAVIGNTNVPVFTYDGTVTGPLDYYRSAYNLDPADASTPGGVPTTVTWEWITATDFLGTTDVITFPAEDNRPGMSTVGYPASSFEGRYIMVRSTARNTYGQSTTVVSSTIGPLGRLPVLTQQGTIKGTFQINTDATIDKEWAFSNATEISWNWVYSDDPTFLDGNDTIFQVGGDSANIPPEARDKYIGMIGAGSNSTGTVLAQSPAYGPVRPDPNPYIITPGKIVGDLLYGSQQPVQFLLPEIGNLDSTTEISWRWELEMAPGNYKFLQDGGTLMTLDWTETTGGGQDVYGTHLLNKRVSIPYTITTPGGGTTSGRIFSETVTDCFIALLGDGDVFVTGGTKSATGPAVFAGMTLTANLPQFSFMTTGWENSATQNPANEANGGVNPRVSWDWIYADSASGVSSINLIQNGCYPEKPQIYIPFSCLTPAKLEVVYATTKGVYTITGVEPTGYVDNRGGSIDIASPSGYPGGAPTVKEVFYATRPSDGSTWISQIVIENPGYGYEDGDSVQVRVSGTPVTNQQFRPTFGWLTQGINIVDPGAGYVNQVNPILVNSAYDQFPLYAEANVVGTAKTLASNVKQYTLPVPLPGTPLANDGVIGISVTARGTSVSAPPVLLQTNIVYEYYAPAGNTAALLQAPTIYGISEGTNFVSIKAAFAAFQNPGATNTGGIQPQLAVPAEVGALPIYPDYIRYTWQWENPLFPGSWFSFASGEVIGLQDNRQRISKGRIRCRITASNGNGPMTEYITPAQPYTEPQFDQPPTEAYAPWGGYISMSDYKTLTYNPNLTSAGETPVPGQVRKFTGGTNYPGTPKLWLFGYLANGQLISYNLNAVPGDTVQTFDLTSFTSFSPNQVACFWIKVVPSTAASGPPIATTNVIALAPVKDYITAGLPSKFSNPATAGVNAAISEGSGGWIGLVERRPIYTWDDNGLYDTLIQANPPVGNLTRGTNPPVPYSAVDSRGFAGAVGNSSVFSAAPDAAIKFNPNASITAPPILDFYYGYQQYANKATRFCLGFQWNWRIEDMTNISLIGPAQAARWVDPAKSGLIGPYNTTPYQDQLLFGYGPSAVPYYVNQNGFQVSSNGGSTWSGVGAANLLPGDRLRWSLYDQSQVTSVLPADPQNSVPAWWVVANPDGSGIRRVAPVIGNIDTAWVNPLAITSAQLGKMIGLELQPFGLQNSATVWPNGVPQYFWAAYCSTSRKALDPFPPTV